MWLVGHRETVVRWVTVRESTISAVAVAVWECSSHILSFLPISGSTQAIGRSEPHIRAYTNVAMLVFRVLVPVALKWTPLIVACSSNFLVNWSGNPAGSKSIVVSNAYTSRVRCPLYHSLPCLLSGTCPEQNRGESYAVMKAMLDVEHTQAATVIRLRKSVG